MIKIQIPSTIEEEIKTNEIDSFLHSLLLIIISEIHKKDIEKNITNSK